MCHTDGSVAVWTTGVCCPHRVNENTGGAKILPRTVSSLDSTPPAVFLAFGTALGT